jgi:predicted phage terminase large subunit-like protein
MEAKSKILPSWLERIKNNPELIVIAAARKRLENFARYIQPEMDFTPYHHVYYELLDRFAHGKIKKMIVQMPPQHGKAISDYELVPTPTGYKRHGELRVGDTVFDGTGTPTRVRWVSEPVEMEYVVTFSDGQKIRCHGRHEWVITRYMGRRAVIETQKMAEIGVVDRYGAYRFHVDANTLINYRTREIPIEAYTLGLWLGCGLPDKGTLRLKKFNKHTVAENVYEFIKSSRTDQDEYTSFRLQKKLRAAGLLGFKHIPDAYKYNSEHVRRNLIAGIIDSLGNMETVGERMLFTTTNTRLACDIAEVLRSLGNKVGILTRYAKNKDGKPQGRMQYRISFVVYDDFPTRVRKLRYTPNKKRHSRAIVSIDRVPGLGLGRCINVDGGVYLVGETFVPTHNSEGSSRKLPAFLLGINPDLRICIGSYSTTIARDFNRDVQRIMETPRYQKLFPGSLMGGKDANSEGYQRNSDVIEMVGRKGSLRVVGRGGSLTSKTVDISILDDVYKDYSEGNSPVIREAAWKWYTTVVRTRLHNESQELIVFTRWHEDDLIGRIEQSGEQIIDVRKWSDVDNVPKGAWVRINFEALKESAPSEIDPRNIGEALWPERHSREKLELQKELDPVQFECLHQGNPGSAEGRLYQAPFKVWADKADWGTYVRSGNYTDVADSGDDYLASVCYEIYKSPNSYYNENKKRFEPILYVLVTDIVYTQENTDVTLVTVPEMINRNGTQRAWVESNNGGAGFEKAIAKKVRCATVPFYQSGNKESRIITNSSQVNGLIIMPLGWETRYKEVYEHLTKFLRNFPANKHDDIEDCLTGIIEKEIIGGNTASYRNEHRGVTRRN